MEGGLTLVPAPGRDRDDGRRRRRREHDGDTRHSRRRSRSRSRRRRSPGRAPPPQDWRSGPPMEWPGYAPHGHMWPPHRPMFPSRPPMAGYGAWHVPPPRPEPHMDWRGGPAGTPAPGTWTPPTAPPNHWGGSVSGGGAQPPPHWGGPSQPPSFAAKTGPFETPERLQQPSAPITVPDDGAPAEALPAEEPLPPEPTASDRLRRVRLVPSALSEGMLEKLHSLGILPKKGKAKDEPLEEAPPLAGIAGQPAAQCALLGLAGLGVQRSRLPPPVPAARRLQVCTLGLSTSGLWERFRQRCGTPLPAEASNLQTRLQASRGGGHVIMPVIETSAPAGL